MSFAKGFVFYVRQVFNIFLIRLFLPLLFLFIRDLYYTSRKSYATIFIEVFINERRVAK